jgi:Fe-S-cluster-containing hydrogenase component 2
VIDRRELLKTLCVAGGAAVVGKDLSAEQPAAGPAREAMGVLVDTTKCIGCRMCEFSCADAHKDAGLEFPEDVDFTAERATSEKQWTVVNRYETDRGQVYAKKQCLHCLQPACASACLTRAMHKTPAGPVAWTANKCMGCRFCMVSCPFDLLGAPGGREAAGLRRELPVGSAQLWAAGGTARGGQAAHLRRAGQVRASCVR